MKAYAMAATALILSAASVGTTFAQYPGEARNPDQLGTKYDPVSQMQYDKQFGMPDETVREAQKILHDQGFYNGPLDGLRNPHYLTAIWNFQRAKGLPPTTHLDAPTLAALDVPATGAASPASTGPSNFGASR